MLKSVMKDEQDLEKRIGSQMKTIDDAGALNGVYHEKSPNRYANGSDASDNCDSNSVDNIVMEARGVEEIKLEDHKGGKECTETEAGDVKEAAKDADVSESVTNTQLDSVDNELDTSVAREVKQNVSNESSPPQEITVKEAKEEAAVVSPRPDAEGYQLYNEITVMEAEEEAGVVSIRPDAKGCQLDNEVTVKEAEEETGMGRKPDAEKLDNEVTVKEAEEEAGVVSIRPDAEGRHLDNEINVKVAEEETGMARRPDAEELVNDVKKENLSNESGTSEEISISNEIKVEGWNTRPDSALEHHEKVAEASENLSSESPSSVVEVKREEAVNIGVVDVSTLMPVKEEKSDGVESSDESETDDECEDKCDSKVKMESQVQPTTEKATTDTSEVFEGATHGILVNANFGDMLLGHQKETDTNDIPLSPTGANESSVPNTQTETSQTIDEDCPLLPELMYKNEQSKTGSVTTLDNLVENVEMEDENSTDISEPSKRRKRNSGEDRQEKETSCKKARLDEGAEESVSQGTAASRSRALVDSDDEDADDPEPIDGGEQSDSSSKAERDKQRVLADSDDDNCADQSSTPSTCPSPSIPSEAVSFANALCQLRRGTLAHLSKSDFEELLIQKICEVITERSPLSGELRRRCQFLEEQNDKLHQTVIACKKQLLEQQTVMEKYLSEIEKQRQNFLAAPVSPVRITRSVGLQVAVNVKKPCPQTPAKVQIKPSPSASKINAVATKSSSTATTETKPNKKTIVAPSVPVKVPGPVTLVTPPKQFSPSRLRVLKPVAINELKPLPRLATTNKFVAIRAARPAQLPSVVDLTDDVPGVSTPPSTFVTSPQLHQQFVLANSTRTGITLQAISHPAPLPSPPKIQPYHSSWKRAPPQPSLKITNDSNGIILSWDMSLSNDFEKIKSYQLYAYQESAAPITANLWRQVGDVAALPLPMACTLSSFVPGNHYHFSVRAVDIHTRIGPFSLPGSIKFNSHSSPSNRPPTEVRTVRS